MNQAKSASPSQTSSFLGLILQGPTAQILLEIICNLGLEIRSSHHDGGAKHQVLEINHGFLEFYDSTEEYDSAALAVETYDIDTVLDALPQGYSVVYRGETELETYSSVVICKYPQGFQIKVYEQSL